LKVQKIKQLKNGFSIPSHHKYSALIIRILYTKGCSYNCDTNGSGGKGNITGNIEIVKNVFAFEERDEILYL
jgi:hypothetical protein